MKLLVVFIAAALVGGAVGARFAGDIAGALIPDAGSHGAWYASRAAGVASYLCLWLGLVGGLWMSSAWFDGWLNRGRLLAIHQTASIAGVALGLSHGLVLIPDGWTHFTVADVLIPYGSYYKAGFTAFGQGALYLSAVVSFSFWFRGVIGIRAWKWLHYTAFAAYAGALWHGLMMGTDAHEPWLIGVYLTTSLTVVAGVVVRITYRRPKPVRRTIPVATNTEAA